MIEIKELSDNIDDELGDAKKYARLALRYKDKNRSLAETYYNLSLEELRHANSVLHEEGVKMIEQYRRETGEPPAPMQAAYDRDHEVEIEKTAEIKMLQAMYKGG
jgi:hypothetical protein